MRPYRQQISLTALPCWMYSDYCWMLHPVNTKIHYFLARKETYRNWENWKGKNDEGETAAAYWWLLNRVMLAKNSVRQTGWRCLLRFSPLNHNQVSSLPVMPQHLNFHTMNACLPILIPWLYIFPFTGHPLLFQMKGGCKGKSNWIINSFAREHFGGW